MSSEEPSLSAPIQEGYSAAGLQKCAFDNAKTVSDYLSNARDAGRPLGINALQGLLNVFTVHMASIKDGDKPLTKAEKAEHVLCPILRELFSQALEGKSEAITLDALNSLLSHYIDLLLSDDEGNFGPIKAFFTELLEHINRVYVFSESSSGRLAHFCQIAVQKRQRTEGFKQIIEVARSILSEGERNSMPALQVAHEHMRGCKADASWVLETWIEPLMAKFSQGSSEKVLLVLLIDLIHSAKAVDSGSEEEKRLIRMMHGVLGKGANPRLIVPHSALAQRSHPLAPALVHAAALGNDEVMSALLQKLPAGHEETPMQQELPSWAPHGTPVTAALLTAIYHGHVHLIQPLIDAGARLADGFYAGEGLCDRFRYFDDLNAEELWDKHPLIVLKERGEFSAGYPRKAMLQALIHTYEAKNLLNTHFFPSMVGSYRRSKTRHLSWAPLAVADCMSVFDFENPKLEPQDGSPSRTELLMYAYAFIGNKDKCLELFNHRSNKAKRSVAIPNILAALIYAGKGDEVNTLVKEQPYKGYIESKATIWIPRCPEENTLAALAIQFKQHVLLDTLLGAGAAMPKHKVKQQTRGNGADSFHDVAGYRNSGCTSPIKRRPDANISVSDDIKNVLAKHIVKRYLRSKGRVVEAKEWRSAWMWVKNAWMWLKAAVGFKMTLNKVRQFELLISSGAEVTIEGIGRASDLAVKKTVNSKHKIFNEGEHGVWQPIIPTNNGAETRHLHLFAKHTRRSYFEKLYRAHLNQEVEAPASSPGISRF